MSTKLEPSDAATDKPAATSSVSVACVTTVLTVKSAGVFDRHNFEAVAQADAQGPADGICDQSPLLVSKLRGGCRGEV